jgi:hypothetical protein
MALTESEYRAQMARNAYGTALICERGHVLTANLLRHPEEKAPFCRDCGAPTISACPKCETGLRGHHRASTFTIPIGIGQ